MIDKKIIKTYACINKENNIREISTSGGTFYELARWFINEGALYVQHVLIMSLMLFMTFVKMKVKLTGLWEASMHQVF